MRNFTRWCPASSWTLPFTHSSNLRCESADNGSSSSSSSRSTVERRERSKSQHAFLLPKERHGASKVPQPVFTAAEVLHRVQTTNDVWVTHGDGVYDVTDFVARHPGGKHILEARGGPLETMWATYRIHFNASVQRRLESMRIGSLCANDVQRYSDVDEPFCNEPVRSPKLSVLNERPFDAETPKFLLGRHFFVPNDLFYVRNHFPVPSIDEEEYALRISLPKEWESHVHEKQFSLDDLASFQQVELNAYMCCAGARSREVTKLESDADVGQMGNAVWTGARLRDVLLSLGVNESRIFSTNDVSKWHVHLEGHDSYHMSIPLELAMRIDRDVLLATTMNGEELPRDHGYPCRVIIPGCIGARSVKWISRITISDKECTSPWHQRIYRIRPTSPVDEKSDELCPPCMDWPINSVILSPSNDEEVSFPFTVRGVALPSGGRKIVKVEVSIGDPKRWIPAHVVPSPYKWGRQWAWSIWTCVITEDMMPRGNEALKIYCRAVDDSASTQSGAQPCDYRGLLCNTIHSVTLLPTNRRHHESIERKCACGRNLALSENVPVGAT